MTDTIRNPKLWVPSLYLAQGLPYFAVAIVAGQMLKSMGVPNDELNHWIALISCAWALKPLWSPFLELASSKKLVVVGFQILGGLCLGGVALALRAPFWFAASMAMLALVGISSATHDIACDGLYITSLDEKGQAQYAGWTGTFFNAAKFFTTGALLLLAGHFEKTMGVVPAWTICFCILGAMMVALGLYNSWALPLAKNTVSAGTNAATIARMMWEVIVEFLRKPGIWVSIVFIVLFRAGEAQVQSIGPLFLREARNLGGLGLTTAEVGGVYGTVGTVAFLVGSIAGGYFTSWLGLKRAILWLIIAVNLPNIAFYLLSYFQPTELSIVSAALSVEMFGYGFGFVGLILYMMQVVAPGKYQTAHYAFATGIMQLGNVLFKMFSGDIQISLGYQHFFIWVMLCAIPVAVLSQIIPMAARPQPEDEQPSAQAAQAG
jgi:PAT family beta-lactamase induction signal transducer AmpG